MDLSKLSGITQMVLLYEGLISERTFQFMTGQQLASEKWYILVRYYGDLSVLQEAYDFQYYSVNANFAYLSIDKDKIGMLSEERIIIFIEIPMVLSFITDENFNSICLPDRVYNEEGFGLSGKGTLVGIIDSGIDYFHSDFRNEDGTTRLQALWDQTAFESQPLGVTNGHCSCGKVYTREQLNEALAAPTKLEGLSIVPSEDVLGHGTAIAGIAAGNGRASSGRYQGVAPESELIVVKVGSPDVEGAVFPVGPTTAQIILGIDYIIKQAIGLDKPVSINIGYGLNEGLHNGQDSLEVYIDQISLQWRTNIVVGVGNQGNKDSHTSGKLENGKTMSNDIFMDNNQPYYYFTAVFGREDSISIEIKSPSGESTGRIDSRLANQGVIIGNNSVIVNFIPPNNVAFLNQINVLIDKFEGEEISTGVWQVIFYGDQILTGTYNVWGISIDPLRRLTRFLNPDPTMTLTIPSTSSVVTSVGSFNGFSKQIPTFSGRGYPQSGMVKPDFMAPGVNVVAPTSLSENGYATVSGTSASAGFTTGAYALLYQYGIEKSEEAYLYGEALKSIMIQAASRPIQNRPYPNPSWGYGILCVEETLDRLKELYTV